MQVLWGAQLVALWAVPYFMSQYLQMKMQQRYILVCDERGTIRWPSRTKTWALGGFIIPWEKQGRLISVWNAIKLRLCGDKTVELKWSHFFEGKHQERMTNPLLSNNPQEWRKQAKWALSTLFTMKDVLPLTSYVRKDVVSDDAFKITKSGKKILNIDVLWVTITGQFALFLKEHNGIGEIWFDQLGSRSEEARKVESWKNLLEATQALNPRYQEWVQRISPNLKFFDSRVEPLVQVADFVSGVIWAASEEDEEFLLRTIRKYSDYNDRTYRLFKIQ